MEELYQGRWSESIMADYCWSLQGETVNIMHRRKANKQKMVPLVNKLINVFFVLVCDVFYTDIYIHRDNYILIQRFYC